MVRISGCRKGFTLVEMSIVILLILILAIPLSTLIINYVQGNLFESSYVKEQYFANVIMQDIEQRIRRADNGSISFSNYTLSFTYTDADANGTKKSTLYCVYKFDTANKIFLRGIGTSANPPLSTFPPGLENGIITNFNASPPTTTPYTVTISLTTKSNFTLQKTIYLLNYSR
ncbi:MAG: prepilin-type N-terminal cleavage/methylation domain-containing protein [Caldisericum sp.]|nr:prepilin-type N-terminal cleavage/methylation domain-containing protein [Caldisericum sp.]